MRVSEKILTDNFAARHHPFEGCFNFRDIGGYTGLDGRKVRWHRYFRAGRQDRMTQVDLDLVAEFGIKTQIDLRREDEIQDQGRGPLENLGSDYAWHPVIPNDGPERLSNMVGDTGISGARYLGYLKFNTAPWRGIFDVMANADQHPILIHCTAGKDRTGVTTALLLSILGVDRHTIENDYTLTNRDCERQVNFIEQGDGLPEGMSRESMLQIAGVPNDAIVVFLDGLEREYGSALNYLVSIGVDEVQQQAIREALLEPT